MSTMQFDNQLGSRDLSHLNLLLATVNDQQLLFQFEGKSIPGVCRVVSEEYTKNGKWSHTTWSVELAPGITGFAFSQDWGTGKYLAPSWEATLSRFQTAIAYGNGGPNAPQLGREAVERFVRATFRSAQGRAAIEAMDKAEEVLKQPAGPALLDLLHAQEELAASQADHDAVLQEIAAMEQAEEARKEAAALKARTAQARAAMTRGASLADLKALLP